MVFLELMKKGGPVMWIILFCSLLSLFIFLVKVFQFHREEVGVRELLRGLFNVLFATEELQISKDVCFKIGGYIGPFILLLYFIMGFLVDYFKAIRVYFAGMILVIAANIYGYFFCHGFVSYVVVAVALSIVYCIQNSSTMPLFVDVLPKDRYGQFCSAQALFRSVLMFICNAIAGITVALFGYRFIFVWDALFTIFALFATFMMARRWSQLGGIKSYIAPFCNFNCIF